MSFSGINPMGSLPAAAMQGYASPTPYSPLAAGFPAQPAQPLTGGFPSSPMSGLPALPTYAPVGDAKAGAAPETRSLAMKVTSAVKAALKELGLYKGPVNGTADAELRTSILAFQVKNGLPKTGKADTKTRRKLSAKIRARQAVAPQAKATPAPVRVQGTAVPTTAPVMSGTMPGLTQAPAPTSSVPQGMGIPQGMVGSPNVQTMPYMPGVGGFDPLTGFNGLGAVPQVPDAGPQVNATNQGGLGTGGTGSTQKVENRNTFTNDHESRSPMISPWGTGLGMGYGAGTAPYPYVGWGGAGSSMAGTALLGQQSSGGVGGFFSRLFN